MAEAVKEFILNYAMNRWQLNFKKNVGATSDSIRLCNPSSFEEWRDYYFTNVRSPEHLISLGRRLYQVIHTILPDERRFHPDLLNSINEQDCINYISDVVLVRTYNGYMKEHGR